MHLFHHLTESVAIAELKVWKVEKCSNFPEGIKYSLFLIDVSGKKTIIGFDNHRPKGHHIHIGENEEFYKYLDAETLIEDFWTLVNKEGYFYET